MNKLKIRRIISGLLVLGLSASVMLGCQKKVLQATIYEQINTEEEKFPTIKEIVDYLCSEVVKDREIGQEGNEVATKYIENLFNSIKLDKVFNDSYLNEFEVDDYLINNVVGKISGENNSTTIVLTAHLDAWYNGALDNASGVATVLSIANKLKIQSEEGKLKYDVIFCITNAEMSLFDGSKNFVSEITSLYENIYNINIDCVGSKEAGPIALKNISIIDESKKLYNQIEMVFEENDIEFVDDFSTEKVKMAYEQNMGVSDYFAFEEKGIPNIHIAQQGISPFILNEDDKPENLDYIKIEDLASAVSIFINKVNLEE